MTQRIPISVASRKGVAWLVDQAKEQAVVLTSSSQSVDMVVRTEELDDMQALLRDSAEAILDVYVDKALERSPADRSLEEVCGRLGLDINEILEVSERPER